MPVTLVFEDTCNVPAGPVTVGAKYDVVLKTANGAGPVTDAFSDYLGDGFLRERFTGGGYSSGVRKRLTYVGAPAHQRVEVAYRYTDLLEQFDGIGVRGSGEPTYNDLTRPFSANCYFISARRSINAVILEKVGDEPQQVASVPMGADAYAVGDVVELVIDTIVSDTAVRVKVKHWKRGTTAPTTGGPDSDGYQLVYVDTAADRKTGNRITTFALPGWSQPTGLDTDYLRVYEVTAATVAAAATASDLAPAVGEVVVLDGTPAGGNWSQDSGPVVPLSAPSSDADSTQTSFAAANASTTATAPRVFRYTVPGSPTTFATVTVTTAAAIPLPTVTVLPSGYFQNLGDGRGYVPMELYLDNVPGSTTPGTTQVTPPVLTVTNEAGQVTAPVLTVTDTP